MIRYLGDLSNWPPQTHYRCVEMEGCNLNLGIPPTTTEGNWSASKIGKLPIPIITKEQCEHIEVSEDIAFEINEL